MIECKECKHHKGDCVLLPDSKEECPYNIEKALAWINSELLSLHNAPNINGCEMTDDWRNAINALEVAKNATHQMQESATPNEWISVKERLPCAVGKHIVSDGAETDVYHYCFGWKTNDKCPAVSATNITHWMPLPQPPED